MTQAILVVAFLLLVGVALRSRFRIFQWLYIPASVIGGLIGLFVVQWLIAIEPESSPQAQEQSTSTTEMLVDTLGDWPGFLIAIVFAGMLLERKPVPIRESISQVGRQGVMVWIIVLGQTAVGLLATWLLILPFFDVPNSLGMLIETGFAGGHGTASAMGNVFASRQIDFVEGKDLGVLMATGGLIYGIVTGIFWINLALRWGWVSSVVGSPQATDRSSRSETPIGMAKIGSETIDPLLLQMIWLAAAMAIGMAMHGGMAMIAGWIDGLREIAPTETSGFAAETSGFAADQGDQELSKRLAATSVLDFPLFIYTLFGGWIVRRVLMMLGQEHVVDRETINRLTSTAMDVLVVAAITSLQISQIASYLGPFLILFACGAVWAGLCLLVFARWVLPEQYWFQLGLINYGMSTGTTATGFVLLRVVDPELESGAAEDYALAAPLSSPFIGGGILTIALPLLVLERVSIAIPAIVVTAIVVALILVGTIWNRRAGKTS